MNKDSNEKKEKGKFKISQEDIMKVLDACYEKCLNGIPHVSKSVEDFANDYLGRYPSPKYACKAMINNQIIKCTTSGFITGFGGVITLPVAVPANVSSVLYVQMRMIACTAYMSGLELDNDATQTFVYACLAGVAVSEIVKNVGIRFGTKLTESLLKKMPGKVLTKINQKVGFRFLTKFGEKGLINLDKCIPVVGALVGGGLDFAETKVIAGRAYKWFIEGDFSEDEKKESDAEISDDGIDITAEDYSESTSDNETEQS